MSNALGQPQTLFALAGFEPTLPELSRATLVLIDYQNEYLQGPVALPGARDAVRNAVALLQRARAAHAKIVHVAHKGERGGLFDRDHSRGQFIDPLAPAAGEIVVEKPRPNAFSGTALADLIEPPGPLVVIGFMTHMCVSASVRAALDLGYTVSVAADACATRALPKPGGGVVSAETLHDAELAALADRYAGVFPTAAFG
jgi:nicotinamidase-related amidase